MKLPYRIQEIHYNSDEYSKMLALRNEVLRKPLGLEFSCEDLEKEKDDIFISLSNPDQIIACCILTELDPSTIKFRQMAVSDSFRNMSFGSTLLKTAEKIALKKGYNRITLHARLEAAAFYEKLGYEKIGKPFTEVTILHYLMKKDIS